MPDLAISERDIRTQLQRLLDHPEFSATPQRRAFLAYVVDEYLAGRAGHIKGVSIAMSVFDRDASFDQQSDPVVRLEARRLRQDIDGYYAGPGRDDPIRLSIPKGGYAPRFERMTFAQPSSVQPASEPMKKEGRSRSTRIILASCLGVVCAVIWAGWSVLYDPPSERDPGLPKGPIIAVLPFDSLGEASLVLADGITQQLTTELIRFNDLWVLPLGTVGRFRGGDTDPQTLRTEFKADYALEGSVLETRDSLRLSARLINLAEARYVWVRSYSVGRSPTEIYRAQDQIIRDVTGQLAGKYGLLTHDAMRSAARTPPRNRDAYDCVLEYYAYQIRINLSRHAEVKSCILKAVDQNPDYAEAWAVLSNLYLQQVRFNLGGDRTQVLQSANVAARRALQIDPNLPTAHLMLANLRFVMGDMDGFRKSGAAAIDLNPNDAAILAHYGMRRAFGGDWDEGLALVDRAIALNPVYPHWYRFPRVFYLFDQGEFEQALTELNQIEMPDFFWTHLWRAALSHEAGQPDRAKAAIRDLLRLQPEFSANALKTLSIWQLDEAFKQKLLRSLSNAGLPGDT